MTNEKSIGIHFIGLDTRERAIFDRVITFNKTHGLKSHTADQCEAADLIVISDTEIQQSEQYKTHKTLLVLCNDGSQQLGDFQLKRPLLITKVMNSLGDALEHLKTNKAMNETGSTESTNELETIQIENHSQDESAPEVISGSDTPVTAASHVDDEQNNSEETKLHALVIDDSASIRKQLELELRDAGITSDFAESGEMALEKIKEQQFDLVFLDIIMPGIDGYETCKAMRATAEYKKTPIIMLSGKTSPLDEVQGVIAGATTYLTKPVKSDKLQETLQRVSKWINNFAATKKTETA